MNGKYIRMCKEKGRGSLIWLLCRRSEGEVVSKVVCGSGCVERQCLLVVVMKALYKSTGSCPSTCFVETDIRDIKREVKELQRTMEAIDIEGSRHLENVDKYLDFLRKQINRSVKNSKNAVIGLVAELEIKVENVALKVVKMEVAANPGASSHAIPCSSSCPDEKNI